MPFPVRYALQEDAFISDSEAKQLRLNIRGISYRGGMAADHHDHASARDVQEPAIDALKDTTIS